MKITHSVIAALMVLPLNFIANSDDGCHYMKQRSALTGYDTGGPFRLEHFKMTKDRQDLREFLWSHWHNHVKGVAEAKVGTVDVGTLTELYVIQSDSKGQWGIDVEVSRPVRRPTCSTFHVDALVRFPILNPDEDYPSQTLGPYFPDGRLPETHLADSEIKDPKYWKLILVENGKGGNTI